MEGRNHHHERIPAVVVLPPVTVLLHVGFHVMVECLRVLLSYRESMSDKKSQDIKYKQDPLISNYVNQWSIETSSFYHQLSKKARKVRILSH